MNLLDTCIEASAPVGNPTPTWRGANKSLVVLMTYVLTHLEARRRQIDPTAMGRISRSFLARASRRPPKRIGIITSEQSPLSRVLTKPVKATTKGLSVPASPTKSLRCWGVNPSIPQKSRSGRILWPTWHRYCRSNDWHLPYQGTRDDPLGHVDAWPAYWWKDIVLFWFDWSGFMTFAIGDMKRTKSEWIKNIALSHACEYGGGRWGRRINFHKGWAVG